MNYVHAMLQFNPRAGKKHSNWKNVIKYTPLTWDDHSQESKPCGLWLHNCVCSALLTSQCFVEKQTLEQWSWKTEATSQSEASDSRSYLVHAVNGSDWRFSWRAHLLQPASHLDSCCLLVVKVCNSTVLCPKTLRPKSSQVQILRRIWRYWFGFSLISCLDVTEACLIKFKDRREKRAWTAVIIIKESSEPTTHSHGLILLCEQF